MFPLTMRMLLCHGALGLLVACVDMEAPRLDTEGEREMSTRGGTVHRETEHELDHKGWLNDGQIASVLRTVSSTEIDEAAAAESKLHYADVRLFASTQIADHGATFDRTEAVAQERHITLEESDEDGPLRAASVETVTTLEAASGPVDRSYLQDRVNSLTTLLEVLAFSLLPQADDPLLIEHVEAVDDQLRAELARAEALLARLDRQPEGQPVEDTAGTRVR